MVVQAASRSYAAGALGVLVALGVAACSPVAAPVVTPETPVTPEGPVTVVATPGGAIPLADRLVARVSVPGGPDSLARLGDWVFVRTDAGFVWRIDRTGAEPAGEVKVDTASRDEDFCGGIGSDGRTLWTCTAGDAGYGLVQLDPATLVVLRTIEVTMVSDQYNLPVVDGRAWVLLAGGMAVAEVDTVSGGFTPHPLPVRCNQLDADTERVVLTCLNADVVLALDAATGEEIARAAVPDPMQVILAGDVAWVDTQAGLQRLVGAEMVPDLVVGGLAATILGDLAQTPGAVWVRQPGRFLVKVDAGTGEVLERIDPGEPLSGGSVLADGDRLWLTAYDDAAVFVLTLAG